MDNGNMAEMGTPLDLFDRKGIFRGMVDQSGITRSEIEKSKFESFEEIDVLPAQKEV